MTDIYGVTGMPLSGKTLTAEKMKDLGFTVLDMGDVVRIEMDKRSISSGNEGEFVNNLRKEHGMDAIAQLCTPYLEEMLEEREKIVITGMRSWEEKEFFEEETGKEIEVIALWSSQEIRRKRREDRKREEDLKGQEFRARDRRELDNGVGRLMALSNHMIKNDGITVQELETEVKQVVK